MISDFVVHHVGARNGSRGFPVVKMLQNDIATVLYEASEDGNDQIISYSKHYAPGKTILVNACIGGSNKSQSFHLNKDPFTSSLLRGNDEFSDFYHDSPDYDYVIGQVLEPINISQVDVVRLDDIIVEKDLPQCDFLSIDVQGGELDVLKGAKETLKDVSGIIVEVEFAKVYKDQPLFGDVDEFLTANGFMFVRFLGLQEWAPLTLPTSGRAQKMHYAADALYLKDWRLTQSTNANKLMFCALAFGQTEFAHKVSDQAKGNVSGSSESSWQNFVNEFISLTNGLKSDRATFNDVYSVEKSLGRFNENYSPPPRSNRFIEGAFLIWRLMPVSYRSRIVSFLGLLKSYVSKIKRRLSRSSELEKLFSRVGLDKVSQELRKSRLR